MGRAVSFLGGLGVNEPSRQRQPQLHLPRGRAKTAGQQMNASPQGQQPLVLEHRRPVGQQHVAGLPERYEGTDQEVGVSVPEPTPAEHLPRQSSEHKKNDHCSQGGSKR